MIRLSNSQAKYAHRLTGMELHVPWPETLPIPRGLKHDEDREATAVEAAAAHTMLAPELDRLDLVIIRVWVALVRSKNSQRCPLEPHLVIRIVGRPFEGPHRRRETSLSPTRCWVLRKDGPTLRPETQKAPASP